jgi:hypothetical protein
MLRLGLLSGVILWLALPATAAVRTIKAGDNLQAALNAAQAGDELRLAAGATFSGNFVLPVFSGAQTITVRTDVPDNTLPAANQRVTPATASQFAKIVSPNSAAALRTAPGAHNWQLLFLEFPANKDGFGDIIQLGDGSSAQTQLSQVPHDITLDRVYIHGDPVQGQKRGVSLNAAAVTIRNCYISDIKAVGADSQAIGGWNGPGPYSIENNYLEAAGEVFLLGGADPAIPNLVPSDVVVRYNQMTRPMAWRGSQWQIKNLLELKNAQRVQIEYNLFENNWLAAQPGYAIVMTPRNQDGHCPWCVVQSVEFLHNIVRNTSAGFNILGHDSPNPSQTANHLVIQDNLITGVTTALGGNGWGIQIGDGPQNVVFDHNTIDADGTTVLYAYGGTKTAPAQASGFQFTNNSARHGTYGINGADASTGNVTLQMYFPGAVVTGNWLSGGSSSRYPSGNRFDAPFDPGISGATLTALGLSTAPKPGADIGTLAKLLTAVPGGVMTALPAPPRNLHIIRATRATSSAR